MRMRSVSINEAYYPDRLFALQEKAPETIYFDGILPYESVPTVAVFGSRSATGYASFMARSIGEELAVAGYQLLTGFSSGSDVAAVEGSLRAGGRVFGVVANGVDVPYPYERLGMIEKVRRSGGVLSVYPHGTQPETDNFPGRARLMVALCDVLIITEGHSELIQDVSEYALSLGKVIMALPGRVTDRLSDFTNELLSCGKALPILDYGESVVNMLSARDTWKSSRAS